MKATFYAPGHLKNNEWFDLSSKYNVDNQLFFFYSLRKAFSEKSIDLSSRDINPEGLSEYVIYNDIPKKLPTKVQKDKSYLILLESKLIDEKGWNIKNHDNFKYIFTWSPELWDNRKYFPLRYSFKIPNDFSVSQEGRNKFCCLIAGNKYKYDPNELYSERIKTIRWFEENHPDEFDLYGRGWEEGEYQSQRKTNNFISKVFKKKESPRPYPSYKGSIDSKFELMQNYKFAICYENIQNVRGYITEKIFDCFFSGTVPVYWGAPDILDYIPQNTFIDRTKFANHEDLYSYLCNMPDEEYLAYINAIESFICSPKINLFNAENMAKEIVNTIVGK